jgi:N-acetylneuraminic acid mutarotase
MLDIQNVPDWLAVATLSQSSQRTSPEIFDIRPSLGVGVGSYSTTLRFRTANTDGSNAAFTDVAVSLQVEAGTNLIVGTSGLATGGTTSLRLDNSRTFSIEEPQRLPLTAILAPNAPFTLNVTQQPQDQRCIFDNGETRVSQIAWPLESLITAVTLYCNNTLTPWTWMGGSQTVEAEPMHGTRGTPSASNTPGAREPGAYAADAHGNLYLFGGTSTVNRTEFRNDLWRYDIDTGTWTWLSGSPAADDSLGVYGTLSVPDSNNVPGARTAAVAWIDAGGDFWLFGGFGQGSAYWGQLNDLWKYDVGTGVWTWMGGDDDGGIVWGAYGTTASVNNIPGGREDASVVQDAHGDVWIFGGYGWGTTFSQAGNLNDLWRFRPSTGEWTWTSGSDQPVTGSVYGTRGVPDAANYPDGRSNSAMWADANGNLWMFGGLTWFLAESRHEVRGDLWRYDAGTDAWTWMSGSNEPSNFRGQYSVPGTSTTDLPSARYGAASWSDAAGNFWMFGGGESNDLWKYVPATNTWSWLSGGRANSSPPIFGTQGVAANTNIPSGRSLPAFWRDSSGRLWLYGGDRSYRGKVSDLWRFDPQ